MSKSLKILFIFVSVFNAIQSIPVVYKGSSPSGDAIVTISSNDPAVIKYYSSKYPNKIGNEKTVASRNSGNFVRRSFTKIDDEKTVAPRNSGNFVRSSVTKIDNENTVAPRNSGNFVRRSFSIALPGHAAAGTGRSFVSTSSINPFLTPLFFEPLNFEGIGFNNFEPLNLFRGFEGFQNQRFGGTGEIKAAASINDNGRVFSNVKTTSFNNRRNSN